MSGRESRGAVNIVFELMGDNPEVKQYVSDNSTNPDSILFVKSILELASKGEGLDISSALKDAAILRNPDAAARIGALDNADVLKMLENDLKSIGQDDLLEIFEDHHIDSDEMKYVMANAGNAVLAHVVETDLSDLQKQIADFMPQGEDENTIQGLAAMEMFIDMKAQKVIDQIQQLESNMPFNETVEKGGVPENPELQSPEHNLDSGNNMGVPVIK